MNTEMKIVITAVCLLGFTVFIFLLSPVIYFFSVMSDMGENTIIETIDIPNSNYKAVVFERDMGATAAKTMQLSIIKKNKKLGNTAGNIFITEGRFHVEYKEEKLYVTIQSKGKIYKQIRKYRNIEIKYP